MIKKHLSNIGLKPNLSDKLLNIENILHKQAKYNNIELSFDTFAKEPLAFQTIAYSVYAGGIILYPQSPSATTQYITDMLLSKTIDTNINSDIFTNPNDKYSLKKEKHTIKDITNLVVLCGSNALKAIVNRRTLVKLNSKDTYVKIHPVTHKKDIEEIKSIFDKSHIILEDEQLYPYLINANNIYTTALSEAVVYAKAMGKNIYNICSDNINYPMPYGFIANTMFGSSTHTAKMFLNKLLQSEISCFFHPTDKNIEEKIQRYLKYITQKKESLKWKI